MHKQTWPKHITVADPVAQIALAEEAESIVLLLLLMLLLLMLLLLLIMLLLLLLLTLLLLLLSLLLLLLLLLPLLLPLVICLTWTKLSDELWHLLMLKNPNKPAKRAEKAFQKKKLLEDGSKEL
jgi:hypothetical protein